MNRKGICFSAILFVALSISFSAEAYENMQYEDVIGGAHRQINQHGIEQFIKAAKNDSIMSKYDFEPSVEKLKIQPLNSLITQTELKAVFLPPGYYVTTPGNWMIDIRDDVVYDKSFKQWVIDGGYTADEPERYMSLRHFFTPTGDREAYLTDIPSGGWTKMGDNPQIDAKIWALSHNDNRYSWSNGIKNLKSGFASGSGKDWYFFAAAWRSLGETMHLVSDMTTPAHVRNDSHPGSYAAKAISDLRADPYEYITGHDASLLTEAFNNPINNPVLLNLINKKLTPEDLFDDVAKYVNRNFFSADTIPFSDPKDIKKSTTRDKKGVVSGNGSIFLSPNPVDYTEDANGYFAATNFPENITDGISSSNEPLIGYQKSWLAVNNWDINMPVVSRKTVLNQARRLIPIAVNSTVKLADLFIPRVKLNYTGINFQKKVIEGEFFVYKRGADSAYTQIDTSIGDMYQQLLVFVQIQGNGKSAGSYTYLVPSVKITNNKFAISLRDLDEKCKLYTYVKTGGKMVVDSGADDTEQPKITISLGIDMGGILVKSGNITQNNTPMQSINNFWIGTWEQTGTDSNNGKLIPYVFTMEISASKKENISFEATTTYIHGDDPPVKDKYYAYGKYVDAPKVENNALNLRRADKPWDGRTFELRFVVVGHDKNTIQFVPAGGEIKRK